MSRGSEEKGYTDAFQREREKLQKKRKAQRDALRNSWEAQLEQCDEMEQGLHVALAEEEITPDRFWSYMSRIDDKRAKADKARRKALGLPEVDPEPEANEAAELGRNWLAINWQALQFAFWWVLRVVKKDLKR